MLKIVISCTAVLLVSTIAHAKDDHFDRDVIFKCPDHDKSADLRFDFTAKTDGTIVGDGPLINPTDPTSEPIKAYYKIDKKNKVLRIYQMVYEKLPRGPGRELPRATLQPNVFVRLTWDGRGNSWSGVIGAKQTPFGCGDY